jgi:hypothetical protein
MRAATMNSQLFPLGGRFVDMTGGNDETVISYVHLGPTVPMISCLAVDLGRARGKPRAAMAQCSVLSAQCSMQLCLLD